MGSPKSKRALKYGCNCVASFCLQVQKLFLKGPILILSPFLSLHYLFSKCVNYLSLFYDPHACLVLKLFYYNTNNADLLRCISIHPSWLAHLYIYTYFMTSALCFSSLCARVRMDFFNYWREIIKKFITYPRLASSNFRTISLVIYNKLWYVLITSVVCLCAHMCMELFNYWCQ